MSTDCIDCYYRGYKNTEDPCKTCVTGWHDGYKPGYVSAELSGTTGELILEDEVCTGNCVKCTHKSCFKDVPEPAQSIECSLCRYEEVSADEDPCCHCIGSSEFKPDSILAEEPAEDDQDAPENDMVDHPGHYTRLPIETIQAIKLLVTEVYGEKGFEAHCFATELKYRLRAGFKGDILEDIGKALKYEQFRKNNFE